MSLQFYNIEEGHIAFSLWIFGPTSLFPLAGDYFFTLLLCPETASNPEFDFDTG